MTPTSGGTTSSAIRSTVPTSISPMPLGSRRSAARMAPGMSVPMPAPTSPKATMVVAMDGRASAVAMAHAGERGSRAGDRAVAVAGDDAVAEQAADRLRRLQGDEAEAADRGGRAELLAQVDAAPRRRRVLHRLRHRGDQAERHDAVGEPQVAGRGGRGVVGPGQQEARRDERHRREQARGDRQVDVDGDVEPGRGGAHDAADHGADAPHRRAASSGSSGRRCAPRAARGRWRRCRRRSRGRPPPPARRRARATTARGRSA